MKASNSFCLYPRISLDISFTDLGFSIFSFVYKSKQKEPKILQKFSHNNKQILVTLSVRTAFDLLLEALRLPKGSEIIMSAVNIPDMVEIVKLHGLVPIPVDIFIDTLAPNLDILEKQISAKTRIILVAHLFGTILNLEPIIDIAKKHNLLLIEDCAQAFCGDKYCGDSQADVSLFSFGPIKSCTAIGGAIACLQDQKLTEKMVAILAQYPSKSEFWFFKRVVKYFWLKLLTTPRIYFYLMLVIKLLGFEFDSTINALARNFSKGDIFSRIRYLPPPSLVYLLWHRLNNYDSQLFEQRVARARFLLTLLADKITYPGMQAIDHSFWLVPILVPNPKSLMNTLKSNGFDATRGNTSLIHITNNNDNNYIQATKEKLLMPEHLSQQILYLPISEYVPKVALINMAQLIGENASENC